MFTKIYSNIQINVENEKTLYKSNVVYLMKFKNEKIYIGSTTNTLKTRLNSHCSAASTKKFHCKVFQPLREFGEVSVSILFEAYDKKTLRAKEEYYTMLYESFNPEIGYNTSIGNKKGSNENTWILENTPITDNHGNIFTRIMDAANFYGISRGVVSHSVMYGHIVKNKNVVFFQTKN